MDERTSIGKLKPTPRDVLKLETKWAGRVPHLKQGTYADGMPLHQVEYLACKLILKPNRFTSRQSLFKFVKVLRAPADQCGVHFSTVGYENAPLKIREVLFVDTTDFRLYNNAFILRRRIPYTALSDGQGITARVRIPSSPIYVAGRPYRPRVP
jgi:hypothetical protein